jgi:hypothetical protein
LRTTPWPPPMVERLASGCYGNIHVRFHTGSRTCNALASSGIKDIETFPALRGNSAPVDQYFAWMGDKLLHLRIERGHFGVRIHIGVSMGLRY